MALFLLLLLLTAGTCVSGQHNTNCAPGRQVITHLFEWRWKDIAKECEEYLGPKGYCGVQISPPNEHRIIPEYNSGEAFHRYKPKMRPWYERYQPVSYKLESRSGTEDELQEMIVRCNRTNVRVYVDAVINHMTGSGGHGTGSAGSLWNSDSLSFLGVPYNSSHFHSACDINDYGNAYEVRQCRLVGLVDLDLGSEYVREKIASFLNKLTSMGVAGFRVDASKHMHPNDIRAIADKLNNLNTNYFPPSSRPFIYQEVIDMGGEGIKSEHYVGIGRVTEFRYGKELARLFRRDVPLKYSVNFGQDWGMVHSPNAVVFVDNHDNQRGHGGGGNIITFRESRLYKMANAFMLAWPYGFVRVMSSYFWNTAGEHMNDWVGPPAQGNRIQNTKPVIVKRDGSCDNGWICEHRWRQISNMVAFRNAVTGYNKVDNWWDNTANQIAFSRGGRGFIAINNDNFCLSAELNTGLPEGIYCDVISGDLRESRCTGKTVVVNSQGRAHIDIPHWSPDPVIAIHVGSRARMTRPEPDFQRTVVLIAKRTIAGQDVFLRGGIDHSRRLACQQDPGACAIPIRYRNVGTSRHYKKLMAWRVGDKTLDWGSWERGQGSYNGTMPWGSPVVWTTNDVNSTAYQSVNSYGDHYWMLDVDMDCSRTLNGWFELKAVVTNVEGTEITWEQDVWRQNGYPTGTAREVLPFCSNNHIAKCGKINVLHFSSPDIRINNF